MYETCDLNKYEIDRYGRQIILPIFGVKSQQTLKKSSILIVGCGGLGCPAGIYLSGAGVGTIGLVDHDIVDKSNLHRQICHKESKIGKSKVNSLAESLKLLNSSISIEVHPVLLNSDNAIKIINNYDLVLDCTDNVVTRYLINDCCVIAKKPLVSASAIGFEGQLTVYNHNNGPCYRCLFPIPPPANAVTNCNEGGVLGPVPGMLGTLQATEAIKILCQIGSNISSGTHGPKIFNGKNITITFSDSFEGKMLLYDAENGKFRTIKLRPRNLNCAVCGEDPIVTELIDYEKFCNASPTDTCERLFLLDSQDRISVFEYNQIINNCEPHLLIDVRPKTQIETCKFKTAIELSMAELDSSETLTLLSIEIDRLKEKTDNVNVFVICRRGNHSQIAVIKLRSLLQNDHVMIRDIAGGMLEWGRSFNPDLPIY